MLSLISAAAALIPTALWQALGGIVLAAVGAVIGWFSLKRRDDRTRAEERQKQEIENARATLDAVDAARRVGADPGLRDELRSRHTRP